MARTGQRVKALLFSHYQRRIVSLRHGQRSLSILRMPSDQWIACFALWQAAVETLDAVAPVAAAEAPPEPVVEAAPEPLPEPIPEVVLAAAEPEPVTEKAPDPAEISTPPAQPKRGWWRRG